MKKIGSLLALSISTAILCGVWVVFADAVGLIGWAGFAGCTTYFSTGHHGLVGLRKTVLPNLAGVACGMSIILLSNLVPALGTWGVWCAVITFVMCIISYFKAFDFCPGTFMGCFSTFAANGDWKLLTLSLLCGAILGYCCDNGGTLLYRMATKHSKK